MDKLGSPPPIANNPWSQQLPQGGKQQQAPLQFQQLQPGQVLKGMIADVTADNRMVIDTGANKFTAPAAPGLAKGQEVQLQVITTTPVLEFKLTTDPLQSQVRQSIHLLAEPIAPEALIQSLRSTIMTRAGITGTAPQGPNAAATGPEANPAPPGTRINAGDANATLVKALPLTAARIGQMATNPLQATVLETRPDNTMVVQIGKSQYQTTAPLEVKPGQQLQLKLISLEPQINLQIIPTDQQAANTKAPMLTILDKSPDLPPLLKALQLPFFSALEPLRPSQQATMQQLVSLTPEKLAKDDSGAALKQGLNSLGTNLESLLAKGEASKAVATLKAALLEIAQMFKGSEKIQETSQQLLSSLEMSQAAQLKLESGSFLFPLPFPFLEKGYLIVDEYEGEDESGNPQGESRFSLHLTLEEMGDVQINFLQSQEGLRVRFLFDSKEKAEFAASFTEELEEAISHSPLIGITFADGAENPVNKLSKILLPQTSSMLRTTA